MKLALITTLAITLLAIAIQSSEAATYNFNFYNNDQLVNTITPDNPATIKDPNSPASTNSQLSSAPTVQAQVPGPINAETPKVFKYRVGVSWFADSFNEPENHEKKSEVGYSDKNTGYRVGIGFGEKGSLIITPYVQYSTFKFEAPSDQYTLCWTVGSGSGQSVSPEQCYPYSNRDIYQAKIPAVGLTLEKEITMGDIFISGLGVGGSYGKDKETDPADPTVQKDVKQYSYYATAKLGIQLRPEIILNARAEYGKTITSAVMNDYNGMNKFKIDNPYLRGMAELSYLF